MAVFVQLSKIFIGLGSGRKIWCESILQTLEGFFIVLIRFLGTTVFPSTRIVYSVTVSQLRIVVVLINRRFGRDVGLYDPTSECYWKNILRLCSSRVCVTQPSKTPEEVSFQKIMIAFCGYSVEVFRSCLLLGMCQTVLVIDVNAVNYLKELCLGGGSSLLGGLLGTDNLDFW